MKNWSFPCFTPTAGHCVNWLCTSLVNVKLLSAASSPGLLFHLLSFHFSLCLYVFVSLCATLLLSYLKRHLIACLSFTNPINVIDGASYATQNTKNQQKSKVCAQTCIWNRCKSRCECFHARVCIPCRKMNYYWAGWQVELSFMFFSHVLYS